MAQEEEQPSVKAAPSFYFKDDGIVFVRNPLTYQKKLEINEEPDKIRFSSLELKPSFPYGGVQSQHICYMELPIKYKIINVRARINHPRTEFKIIMDYVYVKTTKSLEEIEPTTIKVFYIFENEQTYTEGDIPYNHDQFLPELKDGEYEISLMRYIGTVILPQTYLVNQVYSERVVHVFARDFSKVCT